MMHDRFAPEIYFLINFGCSKDRGVDGIDFK